MVDFSTATTPEEFIEAARATFRAYVPESDAWAEPNFFSINATVIGGLFWNAWNEARNGLDKRINPQTAVGEYLDIIAGQPPLNMTRLAPTQSTGFVMANLPGVTNVPAGYLFTAADGTQYEAVAFTTLTSGQGTVEVVSVGTGSAVNSLNNRPLSASDGTAVSLGIFGGNDAECDDSFRRRIFAAQARGAVFFGSPCSFEAAILAFPGVTRAWTFTDGLTTGVSFLMEDKYPCGVPLQSDIDEVTAFFKDECLVPINNCLSFSAANTLTIAPEIKFGNCEADICEVEAALQLWLRENYSLNEGVRSCDIDRFLADTFPDYQPEVTCCEDYPPVECAVYNCVEIVGG